MAKTVSPSYTPSSDAQSASSPSQNPSNTPASAPSTSNTSATPVTNAPASSAPSVSGDTQVAVKSDEKNAPVSTLQEKDSAGREYVDYSKKGADEDPNFAKYKSVLSGKTIKVKLLHGVPVKHEGESYYVATSVDGDLKGYLVKADAVENTKEVQTISVSDAIELYDWAAELALIFSDLETIRRNALLSFWKAGALFETDKANAHVVATMFDSAYPYRMP